MLNLNKAPEKWFKKKYCGDDIELKLIYVDDLERAALISELGIDEKNPTGELDEYYIKMFDKCCIDWREIKVEGKNGKVIKAACNSKNKALLFPLHIALAVDCIIEALNPFNFSPDREVVLGKSKRSSDINSPGNGVEDPPLTVASA